MAEIFSGDLNVECLIMEIELTTVLKLCTKRHSYSSMSACGSPSTFELKEFSSQYSKKRNTDDYMKNYFIL